MKKTLKIVSLLLVLIFALSSCSFPWLDGEYGENPDVAYETRNNNVPYFTEDEITDCSYEFYSDLDSLGRCGYAMACISTDIMPADGEKRGDISSVTPSGWKQAKYDSELVDGGYLYNRAHLIGWQLTAENANKKNLITGTRYFNVIGMLPFENMVADYIRETGNHVMYRVTPDFQGDNLLASGVLIEAYSVEDDGEEISFCVYVYNYQPGILINYKTGESKLDDGSSSPPAETPGDGAEPSVPAGSQTYVLNTSSKRFHLPQCSSVSTISESNKQEYVGTREDLIEDGYIPCGSCHP